MRGWLLAVLALITAPVSAATLETRPCPFAEDLPSHIAACSRFARDDDGFQVSFDVAVLTPSSRKSTGHVVYIPGGPGEAPVSEDGLFGDLLAPFADRTVVLFNPRGTLGTVPRLACDFGDLVWEEEFGDARAQSALRDCIAGFERDGLDPARFTSLEIAEDVDALIGALGIVRAGLYGISYGTEAGLHLLAQAPRWLGFAILDSVSVPGLSGVVDEIKARDRFLAALDAACFTEKLCSPFARDGAKTLSEWAAQFDANPVVFYMRDDIEWVFESADILDYLAQLGAYPDGLDLAVTMVEMLQTGRLRALGWITADVASTIDFTAHNLPLMLQAYADTFDKADFETVARPTQYARDREGAAVQLEFQRLWRGAMPREDRFLNGGAVPVAIPTLVLSGSLDPFTPVEWARALDRRFTGLQRYAFPLLGHAVSIGLSASLRDPAMTEQVRCASSVMRAFLNPTVQPDAACERYSRSGEDK